jgi:GNAT superfamily N-acetyltransferase
MSLELLQIAAGDVAWHEAFLRFAPRVFPGVDFRRWYARCGWPRAWIAHALVEGGEVVANVSISVMEVVIWGRPRAAWQIGTVGTVPERRGQGLARRLMEVVVERAVAESAPMFLFANDQVLDFYPRFGFQAAPESHFVVREPIRAAAALAPRIELDDAEHRKIFDRVCARGLPATERFGAQNYGTTLLWHATYSHAEDLYYVGERDALIVARATEAALTVYDVIAPHPFDLRSALPKVIREDVTRIEFGFTPERWWPRARPEGQHGELFVRGLALPAEPFRFPVLAHT